MLISRKRTGRLGKAFLISLESLGGEDCRVFHLYADAIDLRAYAEPEDRCQQKCQRNANHHNQQPEKNQRRAQRHFHEVLS